MEKNKITIVIKNNGSENRTRIMEHCNRKTNKKVLWKWTKQNNVHTLEELMHSNYTWIEAIWTNKEQTIENELQSQLTPVKNKIQSRKHTEN